MVYTDIIFNVPMVFVSSRCITSINMNQYHPNVTIIFVQWFVTSRLHGNISINLINVSQMLRMYGLFTHTISVKNGDTNKETRPGKHVHPASGIYLKTVSYIPGTLLCPIVFVINASYLEDHPI